MTRSSTESNTSYAVAANLSELELKKILIDKMESNKSIHRSDEQKNLYKALVEAYESDKLILDTYGDTVSFKRRRDDEDKDEEPSAGSNRGSKKRRAGKELESTSAPKEKTSKTTGKTTDRSKSQHKSAGESAHTEEPMHTDKDLEEPAHQEFDIGATEEQSDEETSQHPDCNLAGEEGPRESFDELMDTPLDFSVFMMNHLKINTLTPELLVGPTFELMKGTCKCLVEQEYFFEEVYKATTDQLVWHNHEAILMQLPSQRPRLQIMVISNRLKIWSPTQSGVKESARDVYYKRRIIAVIKLQIVEWHNYKHLDWITVRRDDDKLYTFKERDFKWLRLQDIEDMLILLVQGKLTNLQFRCQKLPKEAQHHKARILYNLIQRRMPIHIIPNPRGFIYQNKGEEEQVDRIVKPTSFRLTNISGAHLDKECPLNKEVKSMDEVKYGEFGRPFPNNSRNDGIFNRGIARYDQPSSGERRPSLTEIINKYIEEAAKRHAEQEEWLKRFY
ncbi:hypothetical protein Tco_1483885 [Tanacetum coccineum]